MGRPYSDDLRERVVGAVIIGGRSRLTTLRRRARRARRSASALSGRHHVNGLCDVAATYPKSLDAVAATIVGSTKSRMDRDVISPIW
jgi:hypothetical protein